MQDPLRPPASGPPAASGGSAARHAPGEGERPPPLPSVNLPKGGGAIRGIGEKFATNPVTGTGGLTVPLPVSPGRGGVGPSLQLAYDSGTGNGPFGLGWQVPLPAVSRKTDKGLPTYDDAPSRTCSCSPARRTWCRS